jgi:F-type H+-transporting ATPase subunit a
MGLALLLLSGAAAAEAGQAAEGAKPDAAAIVMHHVTDQPFMGLIWSHHLVFFLFAAALVLLAIRMALRGYRDGVPKGLAAAVEEMVLFIRDEVAAKSIGHDGRKFTPLLCSFFFFILVAALLGLVPFPVRTGGHWRVLAVTSTGNIAVTAALATISFLAQQYAGISRNGIIGHFKGLVPPGLPVWLLPIVILIEILGMFTKPFTLMVRLFANMLAGHMVITVLLLLIPLLAGVSAAFGVVMIPVSLGLGLFILMLEVLVAFIQAYIFTLLSAIFIGMYAHPAH